jgi:hypothetical protein
MVAILIAAGVDLIGKINYVMTRSDQISIINDCISTVEVLFVLPGDLPYQLY